MSFPMSLLDGAASAVTQTLQYLQENAWSIVGLIVVFLFMKEKVAGPVADFFQFKPQKSREEQFKDEMRRARLAQQKEQSKREIDAEVERKKQALEEKQRQKEVAAKKKPEGGNRLGRASNNTYNPLMPGGGDGSSTYRAPRRKVRRG